MEYVKGDLLKGDTDVIVHGCNCFHSFGSGIAKSVRETFPKAFEADLATERGTRGKLGTYSCATEGGKLIINAYTQFGFGHKGAMMWGKPDLFDYQGFEKILKTMRTFVSSESTIGFPKIGAGLARGDWDRIEAIIKKELEDYKVFIYVL